MVPEDPRIGEPEHVCERVADLVDSVERVLEPYAMPMNARCVCKVIREPHHDLGSTQDLDQWSWILPVIAVHRVGLTIDRAADELGIEINDLAVLRTKHL